jgi:hypothetical protein
MKLWLMLKMPGRRRWLLLWRVRRELRSRLAWRLGFFTLAEWEIELLATSTTRVGRWAWIRPY